jgi:acid stress-induced BolA-like protein IbaG/YrbA
MDSKTIEQMSSEGMTDATVIVRGEDGVHFEALVVSPSFAGKSTLQRHRMVYACLGDKLGHEIHALGLRTEVPETDPDPEPEPGEDRTPRDG